MDRLGQRIVDDRSMIDFKRKQADILEREVAKLRRDANEIERLLELARASTVTSTTCCPESK